MWLGRAAFGCAIYPNFSQIFIAGGRINQSEATRQCERYIVANNQWKRLPELREAKFSVSLCFFNNGSTLYCFGGIYQTSQNMMQTSKKIERLSKGQNSWQILDLKLPASMMDLGAFQIENDEVMLYGGFNDGASKSVWFYRTAVGNEGEFYEGKEL
jgi:hypothetical protein